MLDLFGWGFAAGLFLAIPVGPMAIMLINTTITRGWRHGVVGALGMASVDFSYALLVVSLSALVAGFLRQWGLVLSLCGAFILFLLGAQTVFKNLKLLQSTGNSAEASSSISSPLKTFATFVAATVVNPPTALYFLAISASLVADPRFSQGFMGLWFAVGVFFGSIIWQESLVAAGLVLRRLTSNKVRAWIGTFGGFAIIALSITLFVRALA